MAKSTFGSETPPKGQTRIYTPDPKGTHVVIEDEAADGKKTKTEVTISYDGNVHPAAGNPDSDAAAATPAASDRPLTATSNSFFIKQPPSCRRFADEMRKFRYPENRLIDSFVAERRHSTCAEINPA